MSDADNSEAIRPADSENQPKLGALFPPTWTAGLRYGQVEGSEQYFEAIERLCVQYRQPILEWLLRKGFSHQDAEDLAQQFVSDFFKAEKLRQYKRTNVRFRSFLCRCLTNFLHDNWRRNQNKPESNGISKDDEEHSFDLSSPEPEVESEWDRLLANEIHRQALAKVAQDHYAKEEMRVRFETLNKFVIRQGGESYELLANRLGITESNVKVTILRMRDQWLEAYTRLVMQFTEPQELAVELKYLIRLLAKEK